MTRAAAALLLALAAAGCARLPRDTPAPPAESLGVRHLRILHLNDVAHLEAAAGEPGLGAAASVVRAARGRLPRVVVTGGGDLLGPAPSALVLDAAPQAAAWAALGLDVATPGDRDLALAPALLARRASETGARWTSANVGNGGRPCCGMARTVLLERDGLRIGVTGVTSEDVVRAAGTGLEAGDPAEAARQAVAALRAAGAHLVLLLAHGEAPLLEVLARAARPDVVLGGHEGTPLALAVGPAFVVRAARGGRDVVQVDLWISAEGVVEGRDVRFLPAAGAPPEPALAALADQAAEDVAVAPPAGATAVPLDPRPEAFAAGESPLGNLLADLARRATGADVALVDAGSVAPRALEPGPVPAAWPIDLLPDLGPLSLLEVSGADLAAVLEHALGRLPGPASRYLHLSGLSLRYDPEARPGERVRQVLVGERPLEAARRYRVAATRRVALGGDGYGWLRAARRLLPDDAAPHLAARLLARLRTGEALAPAVDGRVVAD